MCLVTNQNTHTLRHEHKPKTMQKSTVPCHHHSAQIFILVSVLASVSDLLYFLRISVVLHLFARSYVAVLKAKFAKNVHLVLSSLD